MPSTATTWGKFNPN
jgi:hypothetical protein